MAVLAVGNFCALCRFLLHSSLWVLRVLILSRISVLIGVPVCAYYSLIIVCIRPVDTGRVLGFNPQKGLLIFFGCFTFVELLLPWSFSSSFHNDLYIHIRFEFSASCAACLLI
jgi:hypothetical protein